ncbi:MAG TPA: hypothetical protein VFI17_02555 [Solirubrobacterales bacterium]|nr:hypothetical protein [Solirubrobacterales bacterium]
MGNEVELWLWAERIGDLDHPIFHLHRLGAEAGEPDLSLLMDDGRLSSALARDLRGLLSPDGFDVIISTHPWSTAICAKELQLDNDSPRLLDCHGEFTPFPMPLLTGIGVDAYVGGVLTAAARPIDRARTWPTGVPVRIPFQLAPRRAEEAVLAINAGHGSWAFDTASVLARELAHVHGLEAAIVFTGDPAAMERWEGALRGAFDELQFASSAIDIHEALLKSRALLTKASGSAVAEALAAECRILCFESGVFWEDDARARLAALDVAQPISPGSLVSRDGLRLSAAASRLGELCRNAAQTIWGIAEMDRPWRQRQPSAAAPFVMRALERCDGLPSSSSAVRELLSEWH